MDQDNPDKQSGHAGKVWPKVLYKVSHTLTSFYMISMYTNSAGLFDRSVCCFPFLLLSRILNWGWSLTAHSDLTLSSVSPEVH